MGQSSDTVYKVWYVDNIYQKYDLYLWSRGNNSVSFLLIGLCSVSDSRAHSIVISEERLVLGEVTTNEILSKQLK